MRIYEACIGFSHFPHRFVLGLHRLFPFPHRFVLGLHRLSHSPHRFVLGLHRIFAFSCAVVLGNTRNLLYHQTQALPIWEIRNPLWYLYGNRENPLWLWLHSSMGRKPGKNLPLWEIQNPLWHLYGNCKKPLWPWLHSSMGGNTKSVPRPYRICPK